MPLHVDAREPQTRLPMPLTITTEYRPATELGYLLHTHPDRFQSFDLSFGRSHGAPLPEF